MRKIILAAAILGLGLTYNVPANAAQKWYSNYNQALEKADEANKPIFLIFVNDHSCPRCKRFKKNTLSKKPFKDFAKQNLILLKVDFGPSYRSDKVTFKEIEEKSDVPKDIAVKGRGPWPYLFLIAPDETILYSGSAFGDAKTPEEYVGFLKKNLP